MGKPLIMHKAFLGIRVEESLEFMIIPIFILGIPTWFKTSVGLEA